MLDSKSKWYNYGPMGMGSLEDMLYCLDCEPVMKQEHASVANPVNDDDMNIWHQRLGHTIVSRDSERWCVTTLPKE